MQSVHLRKGNVIFHLHIYRFLCFFRNVIVHVIHKQMFFFPSASCTVTRNPDNDDQCIDATGTGKGKFGSN